MTKITIGARGSKLSLAYVAKVKEILLKNNKEICLLNPFEQEILKISDTDRNNQLDDIYYKPS